MFYTIVVFKDEETDTYIAYHPELSGCCAVGITQQEAIDFLNQVREQDYLPHLKEHGLLIPVPMHPTETVFQGETERKRK